MGQHGANQSGREHAEQVRRQDDEEYLEQVEVALWVGQHAADGTGLDAGRDRAALIGSIVFAIGVAVPVDAPFGTLRIALCLGAFRRRQRAIRIVGDAAMLLLAPGPAFDLLAGRQRTTSVYTAALQRRADGDDVTNC